MAIYKLKLSGDAKKELGEVAAKHLKLVGENSALKIFKKISDALDRLPENPDMGMDSAKLGIKRKGLRYLICGKYLLFYTVDRKNAVIEVLNIVDGRRNYKKLL